MADDTEAGRLEGRDSGTEQERKAAAERRGAEQQDRGAKPVDRRADRPRD